MGLLDRLKQILRFKSITNQSNQSLNTESSHITEQSNISQNVSSLTIEKDSLQLGIAAGYTGRSIRDIETSLNRIEANMVTKDWFAIKLEEAMKEYENKHENRLFTLENALNSLLKFFESLPLRSRVETTLKSVEANRLTNKMKDLINVVKNTGEISYFDLSTRLNISQDALRGLLSLVSRRTNEIERFERDNKGWVRYRSNSIVNQSQINQ